MNLTTLENQYLNVLDIVLNKLQAAIWQEMRLRRQLEALTNDDDQLHQIAVSLETIENSILLASNALITFSSEFEEFIEQHRTSES